MKRIDPNKLTIGQAADYLGVCTSAVRRWSNQGVLPHEETPQGHRRFRLHDLIRFRQQNERLVEMATYRNPKNKQGQQ